MQRLKQEMVVLAKNLSSICIKMGLEMYIPLSVGILRANGNSNPCTDLNEILHTYPHLSKEGFGPETLKAEEYIFENCLQHKRCSAGCN